LVPPEGHVAWVGEDLADGLTGALTTWCGARADGAATCRQMH
jgi:hypothetical protein